MTRRPPLLAHRARRRLAACAAATVLAAFVGAVAGPASIAAAEHSPGPTVYGYNGKPIDCTPEQFPAAGAPRNSAPVPYQIPFTATLGPDPTPAAAANGAYTNAPSGGYFEIIGSSSVIPGVTVSVVLGASPTGGPNTGAESPGQLYATGCGIVNIPSEQGGIGPGSSAGQSPAGAVNPNFEFAPNAPVGLGLSPTGIVLPNGVTDATSDAYGFLSSSISPTAAANGGLNVTFSGSFESVTQFTGIFDALQGLLKGTLLPGQLGQLPGDIANLLGLGAGAVGSVINAAGNSCTVAIGNLATDGLSSDQIATTGLTPAEAAAPVTFTTGTSGSMTGSPVTGPIAPSPSGYAQDQAALVSNDFWVGKIVADATCSSSSAQLLNTLLGLPSKPGSNYFYAPATFGVYTSS